VTPDLHQRARDVLAQLAIISEGTATAWDVEGHGQAGSRAPVSAEQIDSTTAGSGPPAKERSLHDHWAWKFQHAKSDEQLYYYVLLAEEDLATRRRNPGPAHDLPTGSQLSDRIGTSRGPAAEAAARFARHGVTIAHVKKLRRDYRRDPETGTPWLWPGWPEAAEERAREMIEGGESYRRIRDATGIPLGTLSRMLGSS
jgi:hypothetical protein